MLFVSFFSFETMEPSSAGPDARGLSRAMPSSAPSTDLSWTRTLSSTFGRFGAGGGVELTPLLQAAAHSVFLCYDSVFDQRIFLAARLDWMSVPATRLNISY